MDFKRAFNFLSDLKDNNNKPWFDANRKTYEAVKADWEAAVGSIIEAIAGFDPEIGELKPKDCTFRINRDVRFAKDKSPYKTNIGSYFAKGGKKSIYAGYYVHIDPSECFLAGGLWMPEPPRLQAVRQEIDYHFDEFQAIVESPSFVKTFGELENNKLSGAPKGYEKDNPAIEYLKQKSYIAIKNLQPEELATGGYLKIIAATFREMKPMNDFLNKALAE